MEMLLKLGLIWICMLGCLGGYVCKIRSILWWSQDIRWNVLKGFVSIVIVGRLEDAQRAQSVHACVICHIYIEDGIVIATAYGSRWCRL